MDRRSALVRNTLLTLSYRHRQEELDREYPSVLALLTYSPLGMKEGFQCLENLREEKVRVRICVDGLLQQFYSIEQVIHSTGVDDWIHFCLQALNRSSFTHLFIPILSSSFLARVNQFDDQHPFSLLIMETLIKGGKVGAVSIGADPYHPLWKESGWDQPSPLLKHDMRSNLAKLRGYGVELLQPDQVAGWIRKEAGQKKKKVLIHEDIVQANLNREKVIRIDSHTIITPLAREAAKQFGIELMASDRSGSGY